MHISIQNMELIKKHKRKKMKQNTAKEILHLPINQEINTQNKSIKPIRETASH